MVLAIHNGSGWYLTTDADIDKAVADGASIYEESDSGSRTLLYSPDDGWVQPRPTISSTAKQYFTHDDQGAHISTVDGDPNAGKNVLLDSDGLHVRNGETELASFEANRVSLGKGDTGATIDLIDQGLEIIAYDETQQGSEKGAILTTAGPIIMRSYRARGDFGGIGITSNRDIVMNGDSVRFNDKELATVGDTLRNGRIPFASYNMIFVALRRRTLDGGEYSNYIHYTPVNVSADKTVVSLNFVANNKLYVGSADLILSWPTQNTGTISISNAKYAEVGSSTLQNLTLEIYNIIGIH